MNNKKVWAEGERAAYDFLKANKYKILELNYKNKIGEIDIIAFKDNTYVFVEVKARSTAKYGLPREAVTDYKQNKIRQVAQSYLVEKKNFPAPMRFDVIDILYGKITHIENAF